MTNEVYYQQGDVLIRPVAELPSDAKAVEAKPRGYVLAEGEVTGHAHVIDRVADLEFVEKDGLFYLRNKKPVTVRHEEHLARRPWPRPWPGATGSTRGRRC